MQCVVLMSVELRNFWVKVSVFFNFTFFFMIRDDPSRSELIRPGLAVRVDPVRLLYLPSGNCSPFTLRRLLYCFFSVLFPLRRLVLQVQIAAPHRKPMQQVRTWSRLYSDHDFVEIPLVAALSISWSHLMFSSLSRGQTSRATYNRQEMIDR